VIRQVPAMAGNKPAITYLNGVFFPVHVGVAFNETDYLREMKRMVVENPPDFHGSAASMKSFRDKKGALTLIVCFDPIKHRRLHRNQNVSLIAHECVHVSDAIFEQIEEHKPGDETRAYLVQYLLQEILYLMDDFVKCRKK